MENLTRKQCEIKEREDRILDLARRMLAEGGYPGLSMDGIAEQLESSKGMIYTIFRARKRSSSLWLSRRWTVGWACFSELLNLSDDLASEFRRSG